MSKQDVPTVNVSPKHVSTARAKSVTLRAEAHLPACSGEPLRLVFAWSLLTVVPARSWSQVSARLGPVLNRQKSTTAVLPAFSSPGDTTVTLRMTASVEHEPTLKSSTVITVVFISEPLQAFIHGAPRRSVIRDGTFQLDARESFDPNMAAEPLEFLWSCRTLANVHDGQLSLDEHSVPCPPDALADRTVSVLNVKAAQLTSDTNYIFKLLIKKGNASVERNASAQVNVYVQAGVPPDASINSINNKTIVGKYNPTERLVLRGNFVRSKAFPNERVELEWSIRRTRDSFTLQMLKPGTPSPCPDILQTKNAEIH